MKSIVILLTAITLLAGCEEDSNRRQARQQEKILMEGVAQVGMPAVTNFTEKKQLKHILELRDKPKLVTYTYIVAEQTGKLVLLCNSIGYGIPSATQFTSPMAAYGSGYALPQADPNGLFSPASAEGTWVLCADPENPTTVEPTYVEPRVIVSRFKLG